MKKYLAECLGAFALTFVVALSLSGMFSLSTPILAVLTVGLFVYSVGHISGAHFNPAITIGLWSLKKISDKDAVSYLIAQFIGAGIAMLLFQGVGHVSSGIIFVENSFLVGFAELVGALFFGFGVAAVAYGRIPTSLSGITVAGSLLLGISFSVLLGANGVINPAVAFGIGSLSLMYVIGPIIGSVAGMHLYKYLHS